MKTRMFFNKKWIWVMAGALLIISSSIWAASSSTLSDMLSGSGLTGNDLITLRDTPLTPSERQRLQQSMTTPPEARTEIKDLLGNRQLSDVLVETSAHPPSRQSRTGGVASGSESPRSSVGSPPDSTDYMENRVVDQLLAQVPQNTTTTGDSTVGGRGSADTSTYAVPTRLAHDTGQIAATTTAERQNPFFRTNGLMPLEHPLVNAAIEFYTREGRPGLAQAFKAMERYFPLVLKALNGQNLPTELAVLPIIMSGYSPTYRNDQDGRGLFGISRSTALSYGLKITDEYDERMDLTNGIEVAIRNLRRTQQVTNDWELTLATSNATLASLRRFTDGHGNGPASQYLEDPDFRQMTRDIIPRFYAVLLIAANPRSYGFDAIDWNQAFDYDEIDFNIPSTLSEIGRYMQLGAQVIQLYNPQLLLSRIPSGLEHFQLKLPKGTAALLERYKYNIASAAQNESLVDSRNAGMPAHIAQSVASSNLPVQPVGVQIENDRMRRAEDRIRQANQGDTANYISGTVVNENQSTVALNSAMSTLNDNSNDAAVRDGASRIQQSTGQDHASNPQSTLTYIVNSGDTMSKIALRFGQSVNSIVTTNHLSDANAIRVGQRLMIPQQEVNTSVESTTQISDDDRNLPQPRSTTATDRPSQTVYQVKDGDSLLSIARRYGVTVSDLFSANVNLTEMIRVGQSIRIPSGASR